MSEKNPGGWADFFKRDGGPKGWLQSKRQSHQPVYNLLKQLIPPNGKMLETGCGMAATSIVMSLSGISCTAIDIDPEVLDMATRLNSEVSSNVIFDLGDMFNLTKYYGQFDLVYSGGVLEHIEEEVAIRLLTEQGKVAKRIVTVIPTRLEEQKAPVSRFPYGIKELVSFGEKAGLKPLSVLLFKGIQPESHMLTGLDNRDELIQSLDQISAQRIGVIFESSLNL
jgi:hypothetical protein